MKNKVISYFWHHRINGRLMIYHFSDREYSFKEVAKAFSLLKNLSIKSLYVYDQNRSFIGHSDFGDEPLSILSGSNPSVPLQLMMKNGWSLSDLQIVVEDSKCEIQRFHFESNDNNRLFTLMDGDFFIDLPEEEEEVLLNNLKGTIFEPVIWLIENIKEKEFVFLSDKWIIQSEKGITLLEDYLCSIQYRLASDSVHDRLNIF
jgi:hypothetical protein